MIGHPFGPGGRQRPLRLKSIFPQNANSIITRDKTARAVVRLVLSRALIVNQGLKSVQFLNKMQYVGIE